ncbi:MAG TPA: hypothetical protein ENH91_07980 [Leeuwenhoekiella sp.]|nr:hypothetical protein [Leeuwenhoekiella sp.]
MKNIQSAFSYVRLFTLIIVIGSLTITFYSVYRMNEISMLSKQQMLILDPSGNVLNGSLSSRAANLMVEGTSHLTKFHKLFFDFDPEREVISSNKEKWSYLADKSAVVQYERMEEDGFFQNIIAGSISSRLEIEDIEITPSDNPNYLNFTFNGKQQLMRSTSITTRNVITTGKIRILDNRTINNPHGFMIVNWRIVNNSTINSGKRYE